jgi:hypothetical protein
MFECGKRYIGKTGRSLAMQFHDDRHSLRNCLLEESELSQHISGKGLRVGWGEATILGIESNSRYRKNKKGACFVCLISPVSQLSSGFFSIWIPLFSNEVTNSHKRSE